MKIRNRDAGTCVRRKEEFDGSNMFARLEIQNTKPDLYAVYSYGKHFPMYVFDYGSSQWFGNSDKYSRTTSKHQTQAHPPTVHSWLDNGQLSGLIYAGGIAAYVAQTLRRAA